MAANPYGGGGLRDFEPLQQARPIAAQITELILERIHSGALAVGTRLPGEVELARQFGVSRPTIREAIGALQFAGYVDSTRGHAKQVVSVDGNGSARSGALVNATPEAVVQLMEARLVIEPQAAALAALDPDLIALKKAESLVQGMSLAASQPSWHASTDLRVHRALVEVCRNQIVTEAALRLLDMAAAPVLRVARERAWSDPDLPRLWTAHHRDVLDAIRNRDPEQAEASSWRHLASAAGNVLAALPDVMSIREETRAQLQAFIDSREPAHRWNAAALSAANRSSPGVEPGRADRKSPDADASA